MKLTTIKPLIKTILKVAFLILLNVGLMSVLGYLTLDQFANSNSRLGAYLLSILIPYFIISKTMDMNGLERTLKYGLGFIAYIILVLINVRIPYALYCGLLPCLLISTGMLYVGGNFFNKRVSI
jgi:hypothetical protein